MMEVEALVVHVIEGLHIICDDVKHKPGEDCELVGLRCGVIKQSEQEALEEDIGFALCSVEITDELRSLLSSSILTMM